ncbi:hypothetical protein QBC33DRAFT_572302 [Phialemonium atrogriseum]|uniref:NAD-dependent epimerase/dehydratase domain-containing protein n=1 Tax=Phialemonium atrogriseum TaxID=1093897 RepID=A0AAJ0BYT3_9PEZI|nr:uncharacterized protein QBC33DRAFT_572302 [Phialemonium atrogriseum]KAK1764586.1 hypothetical protein QBC33DRAFT_572302 [Phialemonium atrogriseum]
MAMRHYRLWGRRRCGESFTSLETLREQSANADVVVHLTRIHDPTAETKEVLRIEAAALDAIGDGLQESGKPLLVTSGTGPAEPDPAGGETAEDAPVAQGANPLLKGIRSEYHVLGLGERDIRVSIIRLPPYVYGRGGGGGPITVLLRMAATAGESIYIGDEALRTSVVGSGASSFSVLAGQTLRAACNLNTC